MPRVPTNRPNATSLSAASIAALKRNQACHQCRKRKLKCDANMPCSACVRSHQFAVKSHPSSAPLVPDCTYDDPIELSEGPKVKVQRLEAKIAQLEGLLQEKEGVSMSNSGSSSRSPSAPTQSNPAGPSAPSSHISPGSLEADLSPSDFTGGLGIFAPVGADPGLPSVLPLPSGINAAGNMFPSGGMPWDDSAFLAMGNLTFDPVHPTIPSFPDPPMTMVDAAWPPNLPQMDLLVHLIDTFFTNVPHANRLLHRPAFMSSLLNHPSSYQFPHVALLHAICAISSLYTPVVSASSYPSTRVGPMSTFNSGVITNPRGPSNSIYNHKVLRETIDREESGFGMTHARWCSQSFYGSIKTGDRLPHLLQANIILTWFYYSLGRTVDVWVWVGSATRLLLPLGLNASDGFTPMSRLDPALLSVLQRPKNHTEAEVYRNCFWLSYTNERLYTAGSVWPVSMDDEDISQIMPVRLVDLMSETQVPTEGRQRLAHHRMLLVHPPAMTDSFTLYVKSTVLLGKVKTFNIRFKTKYADPTMHGTSQIEPRETAEFQILDNLITSFKNSFPKEFREPVINDNKVDAVLYVALMVPHICMIMLHDPHAEFTSPGCMSAERILTACRAILELIYKICATSYDLMRLDHACSFGWFVCGAALIKFMKAKVASGEEAEMRKLRGEFEIIRFMLAHLGERTTVGLRQIKLLEDMYQAEVGAFEDISDTLAREAQMNEVIDSLSV